MTMSRTAGVATAAVLVAAGVAVGALRPAATPAGGSGRSAVGREPPPGPRRALAPSATPPGRAEAVALARARLGDPHRRFGVVGSPERGKWMLEDEHGFCWLVDTAGDPETGPGSVVAAGRFAALQAPGSGC